MDDYVEDFAIDAKEEDFTQTFITWKKESQTYHDVLLKPQRISEQYYVGNQTDKDFVENGNSTTVENRVFEAVETIVPIVTSKAHQFIILPGSENETSVKRANNIQKVLTQKYETIEMQRKLEEITRHLLLYRFGVAKWVWSYEKDDIDVEVKDPRLILIPKLRLDPHDLPYKIEIQEYTKKEMEEYFPDKDLDDYATEIPMDTGRADVSGNVTLPSTPRRVVYRVYEVWTPEVSAWFCSNKLLDRISNPYYDFKGREKKYVKKLKDRKGKQRAKIATELVFGNVLDRPTDPYVFFTTYKVGDEPIGSISLTEVGIPIQDAINVQKRQIIDNLRRMGNGQVYVDDDAMEQEMSDNITNEVGLVIRGEGVASQNKVRREPGIPLPQSHFSNLQHSETVFDNLMGVHSSTRGAGGGKTLGQDMISRQQDFTRIDSLTRILNRGVARLALGLVQLMKMYYDESKVVKIIGEDGAVEFVKLNRDDIEQYIEIIVKSGEVLPMDKMSLRNEAIQLWQLGGLDPVTLFERLEFPNPAKTAERLVAWKQGQLTQETMAKIAEIEAQAKSAAQYGGMGGGSGESTATKTPMGESGRSVETPKNSLQRSATNLGGTADLTATPKM